MILASERLTTFTVQHALYYKCIWFFTVRHCIFLTLTTFRFFQCPEYIIHTTMFSFSTCILSHITPSSFHPEARTGRCSCYHTHTPFIDMTSITAWGRLASAQTANCALLTPMKYPRSRTGGFSRWLEGGLCPVSIRSSLRKLVEVRKASQDEWIDLAPSPTSLVPLYLPPSPERWSRSSVLSANLCAGLYVSWKGSYNESRQLSVRIYVNLC